jgi:RNA polymerase sigma-70 factor (ECF subfamily)
VDVLGFSAAEVAAIMATSAASVSSALARARLTVAERIPPRSQQQVLREVDGARVRQVVAGFAGALESGDVEGLVALLTADVTWSMPPLTHWHRGVAAVTDFAVTVPMTLCPSWRWLPTGANGQPAVAFYVGADPRGPHEAWSITVLALRGERIAEITSFLGPEPFASFGLPPTLP